MREGAKRSNYWGRPPCWTEIIRFDFHRGETNFFPRTTYFESVPLQMEGFLPVNIVVPLVIISCV